MREHCIQRVMGGWRRGLCRAQWSLSVMFCTEGIFIYFSPFSFWDDTKEEQITPLLPPTGNECCSCASGTRPDLSERKTPVKCGEAPSSQQIILQGKKDSSFSRLMPLRLSSGINPSVCCLVCWLKDSPERAPRMSSQ